MIYCDYKYNYAEYDFRNYAFIENEDYQDINPAVIKILDKRTRTIISSFDNHLRTEYKKIVLDKYNYIYIFDNKYVLFAGMMYRRWLFLDRTMYTKETDDYYLNRNFPFVFCELIYSESEIIDFEKFARQINLQFPAQQVAVFNINQYNIRVLNDMSFSHDNDDKFHTFAECFKGYIDLYKLLNDNHMRQTIVDNYDYNEAVSYFEDVLKKLDEHFEQFNYKTFTINKHEKVFVIEETLVVYVGVKGSRSSFRDKQSYTGNIIDRYTVIVQELTFNELYNQTKFSKFIKSIHLMDGTGYAPEKYNNLYYRPFKTGDVNEIIVKDEHPRFWQISNFEHVNARLPHLKLHERYDSWEGFQYFFVVYELNVNGKIGIAVARTTNAKAHFDGYSMLDALEHYKNIPYNLFVSNALWHKCRETLIEEAKLCKWKNAKRKGKSYSLLADKVTFYVLPRLIKNKDEVYSIQQEILKQAEDNIGKPFERYVYDIIDYKWKSEELMLECVEKVFRKNTVIHQYRPYFLRSPKGQLSYDVFVCGKNIAFEYQGKQHFEPVDFFGGEKHFQEQVARDKLKKKLSDENGVTLIYVNYDEDVSVELIKEKVAQALE